MQWWDWLSVAAAFLVILWFARVLLQGDPEREAEDAARAHFDRHGRWPDEE